MTNDYREKQRSNNNNTTTTTSENNIEIMIFLRRGSMALWEISDSLFYESNESGLGEALKIVFRATELRTVNTDDTAHSD